MRRLAPLALLVSVLPLRAVPVDWSERNSPEAAAAACSELLDMLILEEFPQRVNGLFSRQEMVAVAKLAKEGRPVEAVRVYQRYVFAKLRNPQVWGLSADDVSPSSRGIGGLGYWPAEALDPNPNPNAVLAAADGLLQGSLQVGKQTVAIGEPGTVNWLWPNAADTVVPRMGPGRTEPNVGLVTFNALRPLVAAYLLTHDPRYLRRWIDYLDDWCLRSHYLDELHPLFVPSGLNGALAGGAVQFTRLLGALAVALPPDQDLVPPQTFARAVAKWLRLPLLSITYIRSNCHNWTPFTNTMLLALVWDETTVAPFYFREARRRGIEDNAVTQNLRDGTETQQCPWYNENYLNTYTAVRLLDARGRLPVWKETPWAKELRNDLDWRSELGEHLADRARYLLHLRTPQNEYPLGLNGGDKRGAGGLPGQGGGMSVAADAAAPQAFEAPESRRILAALTGEPADHAPAASDWFPYAGFAIARDGWGKSDGYGFLFCSPHPGAYGAYRSRSNNNTFCLNGFGQDLLVDDTTGHYMYPTSPITVDGRQQFFHAGLYKVPDPMSHKTYQVSAWTEPADWRWHASSGFDLMEGIYAGPYANSKDGWPMPVEETLRGVTHQRLVLHARQAGVWIVIDRLTAEGEHAYEQVWRLPLKPSDEHAFTPDEIRVDAAAHIIRTMSTASTSVRGKPSPQANVSLYQFTAADLTYDVKNQPKKETERGRPYGWQRIATRWQGAGTQQMLTAVYPREPGAITDLTNVRSTEQAGADGFTAELPVAGSITCVAARGEPSTLRAGNVAIEGHVLLREGDRCLALGCRALNVGGQTIQPPAEDFEFAVSPQGMLDATPIHRPIAPVAIRPETNVFVAELAVSLECPTPGVELHYTLDGSDPTPQSPRYAGPFSITRTSVVRARAYRPGVAANPPDLSGTQATVPSRAVFTSMAPIEPAPAAATRNLQPGLRCAWFEGDWQRLWLQLDSLKPVASGVVPALFDLGLAPADNPPLGGAAAPRAKPFAVRYSGFLQIPADGVYTFHAPREYVLPDTDAGYELNVWLGNHIIPWGWRTEVAGLKLWYPSTRLHAQGTWSIALKAGLHPFRVEYLDYRTDAAQQLNQAGLREYIWSGVTPDLKLSGPGLPPQPVPADWLQCPAKP